MSAAKPSSCHVKLSPTDKSTAIARGDAAQLSEGGFADLACVGPRQFLYELYVLGHHECL